VLLAHPCPLAENLTGNPEEAVDVSHFELLKVLGTGGE
jgi:hypothetical protein